MNSSKIQYICLSGTLLTQAYRSRRYPFKTFDLDTKITYSTITDEQFNELVAKKRGNPFLVLFTADWLGEGTIMDAIIEQLSIEFHGRFGFYRVDTDQSKNISHQLGLRRLPTIFFFKQGDMVGQVLGMKPKRLLQEQIRQML